MENLLQQGLNLHQQGSLTEAKRIYEQILKINPLHFETLTLLGALLVQARDFQNAITFLSQAIEINPQHAGNFSNLGVALYELGLFQDALEANYQALRILPNHANFLNNRGNVLKKLNRFEEALAHYDETILHHAGFSEALYNRALVKIELQNDASAIIDFQHAILLNPHYLDAYFSLGITYARLKDFEKALSSLEKVIQLNPNYYPAFEAGGNIHQELRQFEQALVNYDQAIQIHPDSYETLNNRGNALQQLNRFVEALDAYDLALHINPNSAEIHYHRAKVLEDLHRHEEALLSYARSIDLNTENATVFVSRGNLFFEKKWYLQAIADYECALNINPHFEYLLGTLQHLKMFICDWSGLEEQTALIRQKTLLGEKASDPFSLLSLIDSPSLQKKCTQIFTEDKYPSDAYLGAIEKKHKGPKIRIGYFSADFHNHATAYLMADFFETHDKNQFELIAFSFGPNLQSDMRQRLFNAFHQFIDVQDLPDIEVAKLSRQLNIDIAVDLKGFTNHSRPKIFSYRAAPIQVNYLGYPGTMAADYIDYIIADKFLIDDTDQHFYSEKIVQIPGTYQVNDRKRQISAKQFSNSELGLPDEGFVFCCFNNNFKITPMIFEAWVNILNAVPHSVLWLLEDNDIAKTNIRKEALLRGIGENRIIFAKRMPLPEHLARHRNADLFLDAFPYNGHTTTSDALWAGLPVLTLKGQSFASRVAASLLDAINLPELITLTIQDYQHLAIQLANNPNRLQEIRLKILHNRDSCALFDTLRFTKNIEEVYQKMFERYCLNLVPDHINLEF